MADPSWGEHAYATVRPCSSLPRLFSALYSSKNGKLTLSPRRGCLLIASVERCLPSRYVVSRHFPPPWRRIVTNELLGALVLAHSLRDAGTTKKLAVLVTLDGVTADAIVQLKVRFRVKIYVYMHTLENNSLTYAFSPLCASN